MNLRALVIATLLGAALAAPVGAPLGAQANFPLRAGATVTPDTVRVGDPFVVRVRIQAPAGARIEFPDAPDSTGTVQALDPVRIDSLSVAAGVEQTAIYRVAAWDVNEQPIVLGDAIVQSGAAERHVPLGRLTVFVQSVLPADSAKRVPRPARAIFEFQQSLWWLWALLAAAALLIGVLIWWWMRRRRRPAVVTPIDAYAHAEREFDRIEALELIEAGERGRFVALMVEVLRDYLAIRHPAAALSLTSTELLAALRGERALPQERLRRVLEESDLVKFARRPLSAERARELGREARTVVRHEHAASRPAPEAAA
jgi:hypothetical protein